MAPHGRTPQNQVTRNPGGLCRHEQLEVTACAFSSSESAASVGESLMKGNSSDEWEGTEAADSVEFCWRRWNKIPGPPSAEPPVPLAVKNRPDERLVGRPLSSLPLWSLRRPQRPPPHPTPRLGHRGVSGESSRQRGGALERLLSQGQAPSPL